VPARRIEERLEEIARELMTVTAMLRSAELRNHVSPARLEVHTRGAPIYSAGEQKAPAVQRLYRLHTKALSA
jgi:hypothetical protein